MLIFFRLVDGRQKRWHGKVAKAAAERLTSLTQGFDCELRGTLAADFSSDEGEKVAVCHTKDLNIATVVFAAAAWETVASSTEDAIEQLASALLQLVPRKRSPELRALLMQAGIPCLRRVQQSSRTSAHDPRAHFVLYLTAPGFEFSDLERVYDDLDLTLQREHLGEVDGSGAGIGGYHLDVSLEARDAGLRSIFEFLRRHNLSDSTRVEDVALGQQVHDPTTTV